MSNAMQPRDKIIPWYFVMSFVVIAAVNAVMVTLAIRTHSGLVTDHPYEKGLAYNQTIKAEETQAALGWKGSISYTSGQLHFVLRDRHHRLLATEKAVATFTRPTQAGMDFNIPLAGEKTSVTFPANGLWEVRVDVMHEGTHYQQSQRIIVE